MALVLMLQILNGISPHQHHTIRLSHMEGGDRRKPSEPGLAAFSMLESVQCSKTAYPRTQHAPHSNIDYQSITLSSTAPLFFAVCKHPLQLQRA